MTCSPPCRQQVETNANETERRPRSQCLPFQTRVTSPSQSNQHGNDSHSARLPLSNTTAPVLVLSDYDLASLPFQRELAYDNIRDGGQLSNNDRELEFSSASLS